MESSIQLVEGKINKKAFWSALTAGFLTLGLLLVTFGLSGVAYAVPLAGVGDFYIQFDKLEGKGYTFFPKMGETGSENSAPQGTNLIDSATIYGLNMYKDFKVGGQWLRLEIKASKPVLVTGLQQDAASVDANAEFSNISLQEHNNSDWTKQFLQKSSTITLKNAKIKTHYLFQKTAVMNGLHLAVKKINK